jgi:SMC interacting uncharacterized protein involved in chromosome segregation
MSIDILKQNIELTIATISGVVIWFVTGRRKAESSALTELQHQYRDFVIDVKNEIAEYKEDIKQLRRKNDLLQEQFNNTSLAYVLEVEKSANWERLHLELSKKYDALKRENEELKKRVSELEKLNLIT